MAAVRLDKPIVFFPYDLDWYCSNESGLYYNYEEYVPGPICQNSLELVEVVNKELESDSFAEKRHSVMAEINKYNDGMNCKRVYVKIIELVEEKENEKVIRKNK